MRFQAPRFLAFALFSLATVNATGCESLGELATDEPDDDVDVIDDGDDEGGGDDEGSVEGGVSEGEGAVGGEGGGEEGAVGEGEPEGISFEGEPLDCGGRDLCGFEYETGKPEEGTVCGTDPNDASIVQVCPLGTPCCIGVSGVSISGSCLGADELVCPEDLLSGFSFTLECDGAEDCGEGQECCAEAGYGNGRCKSAGACEAEAGKVICASDADCPSNSTCCTAQELAEFSIESGICVPDEDECTMPNPICDVEFDGFLSREMILCRSQPACLPDPSVCDGGGGF